MFRAGIPGFNLSFQRDAENGAVGRSHERCQSDRFGDKVFPDAPSEAFITVCLFLESQKVVFKGDGTSRQTMAGGEARHLSKVWIAP